MFPLIAFIFLLVPIAEIYLLIQVGQVIGAGWTVLLVVLTAVIGVWLLRIQGLSTLMRAQQKMQAGELPAAEMLEGMGLVIAGALLLTPGFFTDALGFFLLFPPSRIWLVGLVVSRMVVPGPVGFQHHDQQNPGQQNPGQQNPGQQNRDQDVIDGVKYHRDD